MIHAYGRNTSYDAVIAGRYDHIRLFEMGQNKLSDNSFQSAGLDPFALAPATPSPNSLRDAQLSQWVYPLVGHYANLSCRMGLGPLPRPKDPHTPCPECCSQGEWNQVGQTGE